MCNEPDEIEASKGQFLVYQTEDGRLKLNVRLEDETVWLTQQRMAELFQSSKQNISHHISSIFDEGELSPEATVKNYLTVQQEGNREVKRHLDYYNLDMIISVGYRVKSRVATRFRIWATERLKEYIVKGFSMDDDRLKQPESGRDTRQDKGHKGETIKAGNRKMTMTNDKASPQICYANLKHGDFANVE